MKLGITGSRTITKFDFIPYFTMQDKDFRAFCRKHGLGRRKITMVITGGARGIDMLAFLTAESAGIRNLQFLPDRKKFPGKLIMKAFQEPADRGQLRYSAGNLGRKVPWNEKHAGLRSKNQ